ncbi:MAG: ROK family protein [Anaerolineaceae bacterium]|nr:ROK family protein [Anaerolineaceae bacterium]
MKVLGIDIGCTSIKHGIVDLDQGIEVNDFDMIFISQNSRTEKYLDALNYLVANSADVQAIGIGFPSVVRPSGILNTSIMFNDIWQEILATTNKLNLPCWALNDADAAGAAEVYRNDAKDLRKGVAIVITLGTGIGSAIYIDGKLLPNTELGMLNMQGMMAEHYTAASVKTAQALTTQEWAGRLQEYLSLVETLFTPDHIVLGGGISNEFEIYSPLLQTEAVLMPAYYRNQAGVIGAALYAAQQKND